MYSFLFANNPRKLVDNDRWLQRSDTAPKRHNFSLYEDDTQAVRDMNFTLISTLRATGATTTSSENLTASTERFMDVKSTQDIGNISLAVSKVRLDKIWWDDMMIWYSFYIQDNPWNYIKNITTCADKLFKTFAWWRRN